MSNSSVFISTFLCSPAPWPDMLSGVLSDSKRVIAAHSRHFLALTVLFILPLLAPSLVSPSRTLLRSSYHSDPLLYLLSGVLLLLPLVAASSISVSTHHGFFGRPVHLLPTLIAIPVVSVARS